IESGLVLKGLRHIVATIIAELGYDEHTIANELGPKPIKMACGHLTLLLLLVPVVCNNIAYCV
ncbi:MAG: hypothetical protein M3Z70_06600, partial [Bartonella sp.]|nr:hypothetical protein [Bartonella sp.]